MLLKVVAWLFLVFVGGASKAKETTGLAASVYISPIPFPPT